MVCVQAAFSATRLNGIFMLAHDIQFILYDKDELTNAFVRFMRQRMQVSIITSVIQKIEQWLAIEKLVDQMVFEAFNSDDIE